jgi:hypothetical protein
MRLQIKTNNFSYIENFDYENSNYDIGAFIHLPSLIIRLYFDNNYYYNVVSFSKKTTYYESHFHYCTLNIKVPSFISEVPLSYNLNIITNENFNQNR